MTFPFAIKAFLLLGFLQLGAAELLRLDCKTRRDHVLCLELRDDGANQGITAATRADIRQLDRLVKQINDNRLFGADGFLRNGHGGTLVPTNVRRPHYRIDQQVDSNVHGNIQFQVGGATMASCQIRYNPQDNVPRSPTYEGSSLQDHFIAGKVKGRVQDGLDYSAATRHATEVHWRAIPAPRNRGERKRDAVERVLRAHYGNDILTRQFRAIRRSQNTMSLDCCAS